MKEESGLSIPRGVWMLGLVSLLMDLSSEMIHSLLPVYVVTVLGAGTLWLGLIEGIAEGTASISKVFSGVLSDRSRRRKPIVVVGYGLAALAKPLFPLATTATWVLTARFIDRVGKGIRGSPRDALVADITPPQMRGAAYGLRQALDTAGALLGPLLALVVLTAVSGDIRTVFWIASVPAVAAVAVLMLLVQEPQKQSASDPSASAPFQSPQPSAPSPRLSFRHWGANYWFVVLIGGLIGIARFSDAFLVLRASHEGLPIVWTPLALAVMNIAYVATAYPFGRLSDRIDRTWLMGSGIIVLLISHLLLALGTNLGIVFVGIALWGLHMGLTQGLLSAMIADASPIQFRGSAFGAFHLVCGAALLCGSLLAGTIWQWHGPRMTFLVGAGLSTIALACVVGYRRRSGLTDPRAGSESE